MIQFALGFALLLAIANPTSAGEFDAHLKACHDGVWQLKEFENIPNAGVSAYLAGYDDKSFYAYWIIDWDDTQVAGKCLMDLKKPVVNGYTYFRK